MRRLFYRAPKARSVRGSLAGFLCFVLEGENGYGEGRGVRTAAFVGSSLSSSLSIRARAGNFFFRGLRQQPRAGRVFCFLWARNMSTVYSAGRFSSGNVHRGRASLGQRIHRT